MSDYKKGLIYIAVGYLFILININLRFTNFSFDILPNFIGYFLQFVGILLLKEYTNNKKYLHALSIILGVLTLILLVSDYMQTEIPYLRFVSNIIDVIYMVLLFNVLIKIANDYHSYEEIKLKVIRIALVLSNIFIYVLVYYFNQARWFPPVFIAISLFMIMLTISVLVSLFRLSKDVN